MVERSNLSKENMRNGDERVAICRLKVDETAFSTVAERRAWHDSESRHGPRLTVNRDPVVLICSDYAATAETASARGGFCSSPEVFPRFLFQQARRVSSVSVDLTGSRDLQFSVDCMVSIEINGKCGQHLGLILSGWKRHCWSSDEKARGRESRRVLLFVSARAEKTLDSLC